MLLGVGDGDADAVVGLMAVGGISEINCSRAARRATRNIFTDSAGQSLMCFMVLKYVCLSRRNAKMRDGVIFTIPMCVRMRVWE